MQKEFLAKGALLQFTFSIVLPVYSSAADGLFLVKKGCCLSPWPALDVSLCDDVDSEEYGAPGSRALLVAARVWTNSGGEVVSSPP